MTDKQGGAGSYPSVSRVELERLLAAQSPDPHAALGAHPTPAGVVVRAFRPDAERVELLIDGEGPREMPRTHPAGFFELLVEGREQLFPYRSEEHTSELQSQSNLVCRLLPEKKNTFKPE